MKKPQVRAAAAAIVATALLGSTMGSATAAKAVTAKHLPTLSQAAAVVPALKGGQEANYVERVFDPTLSSCARNTVKVPSGRMAVYLPKPLRGETEDQAFMSRGVGVHTVRFASTAKAKKWMTKAVRSVKTCASRTFPGGTMKALKAKKVGNQSTGAFYVAKDAGTQFALTEVYARSGATVTMAAVFGKPTKPMTKNAVALAKVALKKAK